MVTHRFGFEIRQDIMDAQNAYIRRGLKGSSPDKDMWLLPESVRDSVRHGWTVGFGYPLRDGTTGEIIEP